MNSDKVSTKDFSEKDFKYINNAVNKLSNLPIYFEVNSNQSLNDILKTFNEIESTQDLGIVIVPRLQGMHLENKDY